MKRWAIGLVLVLLACVPILTSRSASPSLLRDSDTRVLLDAIQERNAPLSWFTGDWPLGNHFYRPVSTLAFEMDHALYGENPAGYGWTNALLCVACVLLLFWFWRELLDSVVPATLATLIFAAWHTNGLVGLVVPISYLAFAAIALAFLPGRKILPALLALLVLWYLSYEIGGLRALESRMIDWLPGRTASVMTVFALASMALYARYERLAARRIVPEPTPLDPPATKGTVLRTAQTGVLWPLPVLSALMLLLALGSYEQAVMLPAALLGVGVSLRMSGIAVRWGWHGVFWALLVAYLAFRSQVVPTQASSYQMQQLRTGPGVWLSLSNYLFPSLGQLYSQAATLELGLAVFLTSGPWSTLFFAVSNVGAFFAAWKTQRTMALTGYALSIIAFLPMAWLQPFDHYDYWPMAMRSLFVAALLLVAGKVLISAASRPALQAPPRPGPAPGSLPRP